MRNKIIMLVTLSLLALLLSFDSIAEDGNLPDYQWVCYGHDQCGNDVFVGVDFTTSGCVRKVAQASSNMPFPHADNACNSPTSIPNLKSSRSLIKSSDPIGPEPIKPPSSSLHHNPLDCTSVAPFN